MNEFVYKLALDLNCAKTPPVICSGQFDKGRKFEFTITANGEPYDVTGCSAVLKGVRTDGSHFAVECTVSNGKITKTLNDTTLSVRGKTVAKLVISDSTKSYSTQMFIIDVDSSLDGNITVTDDYSILNRLIEQIHALNESGAIIIDDTINSDSNNAVANSAVATALEIKANQTTATVLFDGEKNPIKLSYETTLGAGFATNNNDVITAFISKNVKVVQGGAFHGCTNLTDVYIDNIEENITILSGAFPDATTIHFTDSFNAINYLLEAVAGAKNKVDKKADKATTLAGYGITDGENIGNKITDKKNITDEYSNYPSISYLFEYYYDYNEVDDALSGKLDNTADSVKTDNIANKAVTSDKIANSAITAMKLANSAVSGSNIAQNQINTNHLQSGAVTSDKIDSAVITTINNKYDSSNVESGTGTFSLNDSDIEIINTPTFEYQRIGNIITISINSSSKMIVNTPSTVTFNNLPYVCKTFTSGKFVTNSNEECSYRVGTNSNTLTLNLTTVKAVGIRIAVTFSYIAKI